MYFKVAVNYPKLNSLLTYTAPAGIQLAIGDIVDVPLGRRKEIGCIIELLDDPGEIKAKDILGLKDGYPRIDKKEIQLLVWMSQYYHYSLGALISDILPVVKKRPRPMKPFKPSKEIIPPVMTDDQVSVYQSIVNEGEKFSKHLIHGITGSGKSRIFLEFIQRTLEKNKNIIYLLPEINLTPQFLEYFSSSLGHRVLTFHSEMTQSEKFLIWKEASLGEIPTLYIGVRSSIFLPVKNLGLIIIDEEHDGSFKQEDRCPYHARDVAMKKAQINNCPIVLGSATPSVETYYHFKNPKLGGHYYKLDKRVAGGHLPKISFVDLRAKKLKPDSPWPIIEPSLEKIKTALLSGEQVLVFINRLGFANFVQCRSCGHQFNCPNCSVTLRFFKERNELDCQHCQYKVKLPSECPKCHCMTLLQKGFGTERIHDQLSVEFPEYKIARFDRDEIKTIKSLKQRLDDFHTGKIDILVGTQMLSKGHNFEKVKKVIILGIDQQLNFPDFRSFERVYQTLTQVSGRAGRYSPDGEVIIQTHDPDSGLLKMVQNQKMDEFYEEEMTLRKLCECPPFFKLISLYFHAKSQEQLISHLHEVATPLLTKFREDHFPLVRILGPRPSMIEKRANMYTWTILLKSNEVNQLHNLLKTFEMNYKIPSGIKYKCDIDPLHLS